MFCFIEKLKLRKFNLTFILQLVDFLVLLFTSHHTSKTCTIVVGHVLLRAPLHPTRHHAITSYEAWLQLGSWPSYYITWNRPYRFSVPNQKEQFEDYLSVIVLCRNNEAGYYSGFMRFLNLIYILIKIVFRCRAETPATLCLTRRRGCGDRII